MKSISITIKMPSGNEKQPQVKKPTLLERVEYAVDCFEANHEPEEAYAFIRKINNIIQSKTPGTLSSLEKEILKSIRPIINQFGFSDEEKLIIDAAHLASLNESEMNFEDRMRRERRKEK